jgi:hypothetical protein
LVIPKGSAIPPGFAQQMAALAPLSLDPTSFASTGPETGTVTATAGSGQRWLLNLQWQFGRWEVLSTQKQTN